MDDSHKTLSAIQDRNAADAQRAGRVIYDRAAVRQLLIGNEHTESAWQPPHRKKQAQGHAGRDKAINIRVSDRERSFASLVPLPPDLEGSDQVSETRLDELTELREVAIVIVDKAWSVDDFDRADATLDAIEDLDVTIREVLTAILKSAIPITTSD